MLTAMPTLLPTPALYSTWWIKVHTKRPLQTNVRSWVRQIASDQSKLDAPPAGGSPSIGNLCLLVNQHPASTRHLHTFHGRGRDGSGQFSIILLSPGRLAPIPSHPTSPPFPCLVKVGIPFPPLAVCNPIPSHLTTLSMFGKGGVAFSNPCRMWSIIYQSSILWTVGLHPIPSHLTTLPMFGNGGDPFPTPCRMWSISFFYPLGGWPPSHPIPLYPCLVKVGILFPPLAMCGQFSIIPLCPGRLAPIPPHRTWGPVFLFSTYSPPTSLDRVIIMGVPSSKHIIILLGVPLKTFPLAACKIFKSIQIKLDFLFLFFKMF